jgi:hypothetical protein
MTNDFDLKSLRKKLDALRRRHGADSPIGHRVSNLIERLKVLETATGAHRKRLEKEIAKSVAGLAKLTAA